MILGIEEVTSGDVIFKGSSVQRSSQKKLRVIQQSMKMIYQNVDGSLNPRMTAYQCILEPLEYMKGLSKDIMDQRVREVAKTVGLDEKKLYTYSHTFSGGQKQRIAIARALISQPSILICDEVTSGLDVSVQAQILNIFKKIQTLYGTTIIFITHDIAVAKWLSDRILVLHKGNLVETIINQEDEIKPQHSYTKMLFSSAFELSYGS